MNNINISRNNFLIDSDELNKLKKNMIETAEIIKKAVADKRFILIKHHDDTDGYTSGIVLEKAITPLIDDVRKQYYFSRSSSRYPYYDYTDSLRDLNNFLSFNSKKPLVILCDLGSNEQSLRAIRRLMEFDVEFIIVDHHKYDEENKRLTKAFLNPHTVGLDSEYNAGMIATELALFINPILRGVKHLPGLSAVADRSSGKDVDKYVKISGYSFEELERWSLVIDHETYYLRFQARSKFLDSLFFPETIDKFMKMHKDIMKEFEKVEKAVKKYAKIKDYGKFKFISINRQDVGDYEYASSKLSRVLVDSIKEPRIAFVLTPGHISYRADGVDFKGVKLIDELKQKFPHAMVNGGGHEVAGAIGFNVAANEEIMQYVDEFLNKI